NKKTILYTKLKELISDEDVALLDELLAHTVDTEPNKVEMMKALYAKYDIQSLAVGQKEKYTTIAFNQLNAINVSEDKKEALFSLSDALTNRVQ
ncbi:polyprenyl synthetase family protein, partial [Sphingobacterium shayense]|nr:polyprenyl synthetase family protein [Sphingobacterium shayense]